MSLNREQMADTGADLRANLERAALSVEELGAWLGLEPAAVEATLAMNGDADPVTVWAVRDAIESTLQSEGDAGDWSVLTAANRERAQQWYSLREVPTR